MRRAGRAGPSSRPCYATVAAPIPQRLDRRAASALVPDSGACSGASRCRRRADRSIRDQWRCARGPARRFRPPPRRLRDRACGAPGVDLAGPQHRRRARGDFQPDASRGATSPASRRSTRGSRGRPSAWRASSVASLTALKYAVLAVAYAFAYLTARRVLTEPRLPRSPRSRCSCSCRSGGSSTTTSPRASRCSRPPRRRCYALIRLEAAPTPGRYAWLGLALALGTLSKLTYLVFAAALGLAALTIAPYRRRLLDPRAIVTLAGGGRPASAVRALARHAPGRPRALRPAGRPRERRAPSPPGVLDGLGAVLRALAYYAAPLGLVFLSLFPEVYRGARPRDRRAREPAGLRSSSAPSWPGWGCSSAAPS